MSEFSWLDGAAESTLNMDWDQWVTRIEEREKLFLKRPPLDTTVGKNIHVVQSIMDGLVLKCANPFCGWPIRVNREQNFSAPFYGEICATCHDLFSAITMLNICLKDPKWFYKAHDAWVKEVEAIKKSRKNMGLDDNGIA